MYSRYYILQKVRFLRGTNHYAAESKVIVWGVFDKEDCQKYGFCLKKQEGSTDTTIALVQSYDRDSWFEVSPEAILRV